MLQLGDSFYAGVFRSGSSVAHRLLTSHSKQGISNPGMEVKAEETLKPSEAGLRDGTPTDIPIVVLPEGDSPRKAKRVPSVCVTYPRDHLDGKLSAEQVTSTQRYFLHFPKPSRM